MDIQLIAQKIEKAGGTLYLVGGAIRDQLLGRTVHDEDYCVTGISSDTFQEIFPEATIQGKSFAVFEMDKKEFALARTEKKIGIGHKEFAITSNEQITIEQDLARRDVTVNAMARNVLTCEIIDPFNGKQDLENKILRATTKAFKEDPLRVYRVARFAAQLEFSVSKETLEYMRQLKEELNTISKERVFMELKKALETMHPSIFFEILKKADVLDVHFKEIYNLIGSLQPEKFHPEGDSFNHTMQVVDNSCKLTPNLEVRFGALVHDLGKGITPKECYPHHHGHDEKGVALVESLAKKVGVPNKWIACGKVAAKEHMRGGIFGRMSPAKQVDFIVRVDKTVLGLEGLQQIVIADRTGRGNYQESEEEIKNSQFLQLAQQCLKQVTGKNVQEKYGLEAGKKLAERLREERIKWIKENEKY